MPEHSKEELEHAARIEALRQAKEEEDSPAKNAGKKIKKIKKQIEWDKNHEASMDELRYSSKPAIVLDDPNRRKEHILNMIKVFRARQEVFFRGRPVRIDSDEKGKFFEIANNMYVQIKANEIMNVCKTDQTGVAKPHSVEHNWASGILEFMNAETLDVVVKMVKAPTPYYVDGRMFIAREKGYHKESRLLVMEEAEDFPEVMDSPNEDDVLAALTTLWYPFKEFSFVDDDAKAALISALLTGVVRPMIKTAPGYAVSASEYGSGKSLMIKAIGALASGYIPGMTPFHRRKEEMDKNIVSLLKAGVEVIAFDNINGPFESDSLAMMITSPSFTSRLLGGNDIPTFPTNVLCLITGNQMTLSGDMPRRFPLIEIEKQRKTEFEISELDEYVVANRKELWNAALTILRAHNNMVIVGARGKVREMESFGEWSRIVLDCCDWLRELINETAGEEGLPNGLRLGNVRTIIERNREEDPEKVAIGELCETIYILTDGKPFISKDLLKVIAWVKSGIGDIPKMVSNQIKDKSDGEEIQSFIDAGNDLIMMVPKDMHDNQKSFGKWVATKKNRKVFGYILELKDKPQNVIRWIVRKVDPNADNDEEK
jgi:hypothetical protein